MNNIPSPTSSMDDDYSLTYDRVKLSYEFYLTALLMN